MKEKKNEKKPITTQITDCLEKIFLMDHENKIIIYPCGYIGISCVNILKNIYGIEPAFLIDNHKCDFSVKIHPLSFLKTLNTDEYVLFLASNNTDIYDDLKQDVLRYFPAERIVELEDMILKQEAEQENETMQLPKWETQIGRYSYGPICHNHHLIESIGSFCSFGPGVDVVPNHEMNCITTHPIVYAGVCCEGHYIDYDYFKDYPWYFPGIKPKTNVEKRKRSVIGNDVWLGKNVIIANYANIGNGVIAGAGAVITKDVPDYAIVGGVPAKIIKYRFTPIQISALNRIAWWDWTDDELRDRFDDLYLPIDDFINKYDDK